MRVLVLSKYGRRAASPRHRFLAYAPYLAEQGIELDFSPLLDDDYLNQKLDGGKASAALIVASYAKRIITLARARKYDLLLIHCELFPYFPPWFEQLLALVRVPYVFDYDDAIFHMYDDHPNKVVRALLGSKIARVIGGAKAVMAGSDYLANYARRYNDNVHVIPTVVDTDRYRVKDWDSRGDEPFTIGWIGSPSTVPYLELIRDPLERFGREANARLLVIGAQGPKLDHIEVVSHPWSEETEVDLLLQCDVGVMPLPDEKWARGKCAFKLIQYMACGLPVIASPVGANVEVVRGEVGVLGSSCDVWLASLRTLLDAPASGRTSGRAGRALVVSQYSLTACRADVANALRSTLLQPAR